MHDFKSDFYGHDMQAVVLGYIRPELDYTSKGSWIHFARTTSLTPSDFQRLS